MVNGLDIVLYFVVSFQVIPYIVTLYYLYRAKQVFPVVKLLWLLGFLFVVTDALFSYIQTNPQLFQTYYGSAVTWFLLTVGGA